MEEPPDAYNLIIQEKGKRRDVDELAVEDVA